VRPALLQVASSFLLRVAAASGLGCCNCTDGSEVLIRRAVAVAVARAAADSKAAHVTAWVSGVWCCVIAGAIGVVTHALHGCTTRRSCRVRALHRSVRRLLRSRALRGSLHTITLARRTYGVLLRRQRLGPLGSAVHLMRLAVAGRAGITGSAVRWSASGCAHAAKGGRTRLNGCLVAGLRHHAGRAVRAVTLHACVRRRVETAVAQRL
jgi:hypothetical protein